MVKFSHKIKANKAITKIAKTFEESSSSSSVGVPEEQLAKVIDYIAESIAVAPLESYPVTVKDKA